MANKKPIVVFDLETDGKNPLDCNVVQIAAVTVNPIKLEIVPDSEFHIRLKPHGIEKEEYLTEERIETLNWHAKVLSLTQEDVLNVWKQGADPKFGWSLFSDYVNKQNTSKSMFTAPIAAGINLKDFDLKIVERMNDKYKISSMFYPRDVIDLKDMIFYWFEGLTYGPVNFKMDTLRQFFGMEVEGGHDAIKDVKDEMELILKFMRLHRECAAKVTAWKELSEEYGHGKSV
jgi:DNA polymerase III epsilon subunit-like protein